MLKLVDDLQHNKPLVLNPNFIDGFKRILCDSSLDKVCLGQYFLKTIHFGCFIFSIFSLGGFIV